MPSSLTLWGLGISLDRTHLGFQQGIFELLRSMQAADQCLYLLYVHHVLYLLEFIRLVRHRSQGFLHRYHLLQQATLEALMMSRALRGGCWES